MYNAGRKIRVEKEKPFREKPGVTYDGCVIDFRGRKRLAATPPTNYHTRNFPNFPREGSGEKRGGTDEEEVRKRIMTEGLISI